MKFENGKPCVPVLNDRTMPNFLESRRIEKSISRNSERLKIFSGTANPALSKVFISSVEFNYLFFIVIFCCKIYDCMGFDFFCFGIKC